MENFTESSKSLILLIIVIIICLVGFKQNAQQNYENLEIHALNDSSLIYRGKYLVGSLGHCGDCHLSSLDSKIINDNEVQPMNAGRIPTIALVSNISHGRILRNEFNKLSDQQLANALRFGIGHETTTLNPIINYQALSNIDLTAVISYLRSIETEHDKKRKKKFSNLDYFANEFINKIDQVALTKL